jgi:tRNA(Ile)-lysidine synthase
VAALGERFGWPLVAGRDDVAARARRERQSIEVAARTARHEFFEAARSEAGADFVAVGHTRDDQAETFLLRLLRGAGPRGLAAMHPRSGTVVRPLLDCRRAELRAYLAAERATFVEDESNDDRSIPRNRVRAELVPFLERFNPGIVNVLADHADLARDEWAWLEAAGQALMSRAAARRADGWVFDVPALVDAPPAVRRAALWQAMRSLSQGREVGFGHVDEALSLLDRPAGALDAPGHRLERAGSRLVLTNRPRLPVNLFRYPLSIPGEVSLPEAGLLVSAEVGERPEAAAAAGGGLGIVRQDLCHGPLAVRNRRPGDRFRPPGLAGRKKLQDFFVDRKVARAERDRVPIVVDERDRIVWVAGYGIDAAFRVTDASQAVLILKVRQLGGSV